MAAASAQVSTHGFDRLLGLELVELEERRARGRVLVRDELKGPHGAVHGGVHAAVAESLAVLATAAVVEPERQTAAPLSQQMSFLGSVADGSIHATAVVKHRGRTTWVWEVEISDDRGTLCALGRVTIAVRDGSERA